MKKTIEEAAKRFADMKTTKQAGSSVERDNKALLMTQFFHFALEELPLSSRLTAEEKERIRAMYSEAQGWLDEKTSFDNPNEQLKICAVAIQDRLERIFGADFFKEGE